MAMSATCHLCWVHSEEVSHLVTCLDYWGIAILLMGSAYTYISFKYACGPFVIWRYIFTSIIAFLCILAMIGSVSKSIMTPCRRLILFLSFSASCLIPVILLYFWHDPKYSLQPNFGHYWYPFWTLSLGAFFYIKRIPEKWSRTGRYDLLGASHQIFHILVLVALFLTYKFNVELYRERLAFTCPA